MSGLHEVRNEEPKRAILVSAQLPSVSDLENQLSLDELARLVQTLGFTVVGRLSQKRSSHASAVVLGEGKIEELARITGGPGLKGIQESRMPVGKRKSRAAQKWAEAAKAESVNDLDDDDLFDDDEEEDTLDHESLGAEAEEENGAPVLEFAKGERPQVVVFDSEMTPSQIRNVEAVTGCQVLDRTGVIIEIFSRHARTRAARLQVEIARLKYLAPRIRETGGASERTGGGVGGRGAGESSIELDRRKIRDRIKELKDEFASIEREHETRRARRSEIRVVALVGYTNAGKSSLMRAMTGSEVYVADKLFATLDTTVRPIHPETRPPILISDTVGFIKKLPHDLVASFRSTLDEALNASLLLYVVDSSDPSFRSQLEVTQSVLAEVGAGETPSQLVLNKIDKLSAEEIEVLRAEFPDAILMSTRVKSDLSDLRDHLVHFFEGEMVDEDVFVPYDVQGVIGEIRSQMRVLEESYEGDGVRLRLRATAADLTRLRTKYRI